MTRIAATLLLEGEMVLTCHECGCRSDNDLRGTDGWSVVRARPGSMHLVDMCRDCRQEKSK